MADQLNQDKHFNYLDSARGIAACLVALGHFVALKYDHTVTDKYYSLLFNGDGAVSFFFVLSGFVLSYKYIILKQKLDIKKFYTSRFFRLWPAYFINVAAMCIYVMILNKQFNISTTVNTFVYDVSSFWEEALMIRLYHAYYGPGWSLTVEMVASLLMPFFILIALKERRLIWYLIFALILGAGQNFFYSLHFLLGILICCYSPEINYENLKQKKWFKYKYLFLVCALLLWEFKFYENMSYLSSKYQNLAGFIGINPYHYSGVASAIFLMYILSSKKLQRILENKILVHIGKLSYSIYLVHFVSVYYIYQYFEKSIPSKNPHIVVTLMILGYIVLTYALSWLMHHAIELPFMRMGKKIASGMKPSIIIGND